MTTKEYKEHQARSDDFIDGLQVAYKRVHALKNERCNTPVRVGLNMALEVIDQAISESVSDKGKKLIVV